MCKKLKVGERKLLASEWNSWREASNWILHSNLLGPQSQINRKVSFTSNSYRAGSREYFTGDESFLEMLNTWTAAFALRLGWTLEVARQAVKTEFSWLSGRGPCHTLSICCQLGCSSDSLNIQENKKKIKWLIHPLHVYSFHIILWIQTGN